MTNIVFFIILQIVIFILQFFTFTRLPLFDYCEMFFGSIFIIIFFSVFAAMLTLDKDQVENGILFSSFFILWYYVSKKIVNGINSDINGVIYYL
jgi:hypothetical protein